MEPTIYKPSIYNGAGIYKTGAEGGGGGFRIKYKVSSVEIGGKDYKTIQIKDINLEFLAQNLDLLTEDIALNSPSVLYTPGAWYYNRDENLWGWGGYKNGLLYNHYAVEYLELNKSSLLNGFRVPKRSDFLNLSNYLYGDNNSGCLLKNKAVWSNTYDGINAIEMDVRPAGAYSKNNTFEQINNECSFATIDIIGGLIGVWFERFSQKLNIGAGSTREAGMSLRLCRDL